MKVLHVIPGIAHEASGPSYSVPRLCAEMAAQGADVHLLTSDRFPDRQFPFTLEWFPSEPPFSRTLGRCPKLHEALRRHMADASIVHNHSLWMMANIYPGFAVKHSAAKLVTSPRGTLSAWALRKGRLKKAVMWHLGQKYVLSRAALLHATSESELGDIRRLGFRQPVALVPNGCDLPPLPTAPRPSGPRRLLYLGRIHPIKAVDNLIDAWTAVAGGFPDWELHLVGPGEEQHLEDLHRHIARSPVSSIRYRGAKYGDEKADEYRAATLYILPSHSENFAVTVAEALSHSLPCIVSKGAPWSVLEDVRAGWWTNNSVESLTHTLLQALATPVSELEAMGRRGRQYVQDHLGWGAITKEMLAAYSWLLEGGPRPGCVHLERASRIG